MNYLTSVTDYLFNPYIVRIWREEEDVLLEIKTNNKIIKSEMLMGLNVGCDIQYFLMLHHYTENFGDSIELRFYKEDTFKEFERKFYSMIKTNKIGIL